MGRIKILALDLSTSPGWAIIENNKLIDFGKAKFKIENFNINNYPNKSNQYPYNIVDTVNEIADYIYNIYESENLIDYIVIEGTVRGMNRHTQKVLEFIHLAVLLRFEEVKNKIKYLDPSEWRKIINLRLTDEDKLHNKLVKRKEAKGKISAKHLSVRYVNNYFNKEFKMIDNDTCDAICLGLAFIKNETNI